MSNLTPRINRFESNLLINSQLDFWQRGTSFPGVADVYTADRFRYSASPALQTDVTRHTDVPASVASYSLNIGRVTANVPAAAEVGRLFQRIEGNLFKKIRGKKFTIFFYAKSSKVGARYVSFRNNTNDRYLLQKYTITQADTWQAFQFQLEHIDSGTWQYDNLTGMDVCWTLQAGSSVNSGIAGSWQNGALFAASDQVNTFDANNSYFRLALPIIIEGWWSDIDVTTTPFRTYQQESLMCQRYYETGGHSAPDVGNASGVLGGLGFAQFKIEKRANPTVVAFGNGNPNQVRNDNNGATEGTIIYGISTLGFQPRSTSGLNDNVQYSMSWTADAEL